MPYKRKGESLKYHREYQRRWNAARPGYYRKFHLKGKFGITQEEFARLLDAQGRRCAICDRTEPGGRGTWHIDHDHVTGKIRGLLCFYCNIMLGNAHDDPEILAKGIRYLQRT